MDSESKRKDFIERCKQMCIQAGPQMPQIVCNTSYNLGYWIREYDTHQDEEDSKETLGEMIGETWIGLMCLMLYYDIDYERMEKHMDEQIGRR